MYRNLKESEIEGSLDINLLDSLRQKISGVELEFPPRLDDSFLLKFLNLRRGNVDEALQKIQIYYRYIHRNLDYLGNEQASYFKAALDSCTSTFLRHRSGDHRVNIFRFQNWDTMKWTSREINMASIFQLEYVTMETKTQMAGIVYVFDFAGFTLSHLNALSFTETKRIVNMIQGGIPYRIKAFHGCHVHPIAAPFITLATSFLSTKLKGRVFMHYSDNYEEFHKAIDPNILPESLGGMLKDAEAFDLPLNQRILQENLPYESFWNPEKATPAILATESTRL